MRKLITPAELKQGEKAAYLDKYGILHATDKAETLANYAVGKSLVTDEIDCEGGFPVIDGVKVKVYGAGKDYVYLSKNKKVQDIRYITTDGPYKAEGSVEIDRTKLDENTKAAYRLAGELYLKLTK